MNDQRSQNHRLLGPALVAGMIGLTASAYGDRDRIPEPPAPPKEGGGITLQLGSSSSNRFLPRVGSGMIPVGTPSLITWSYANEVAASDHISPIEGIFIPTTDPNAPTFVQPFVPEQSVIVDTLDAAFPRDVWLRIIARSFDRWEEVCGITFLFIGSEDGPIPPDGSDGAEYEPWDDGDRWESPPAPDNDAEGFYAPTAGYNWDGVDPADLPDANTGVGDIRIAARSIDGQSSPDGTLGSAFYYVYPFDPTAGSGGGEGTAEMGNIILDADEIWNDPFAPNLLEVVVSRAIGEAIGVPYKCPRWVFPGTDPLLQAQLMELQEGDFINDSGLLTRPFPPLRIIEPQEDEIRSAQQLFGDATDINNSFNAATTINFVPEFSTEQLTFRFINPDNGELTNTIRSRAMVTTDFGTGDPDIDFYELIVPELLADGSLDISIIPVGTEYYTVGFTIDGDGFRSCDKTADELDAGDLVNALVLDDLRFAVATLDEVNSLLFDVINPDNPDSPWFLPFEGAPGPADLLTYVDENSFGVGEEVTLRVQPGRYFLLVRGLDGFSGDQAVQRYNLSLNLITNPDAEQSSFATIINGDFENDFPGTGRLALTEATENGGPFTGETSRMTIIAGGLVFSGHTVFDNTNAIETAWSGPNPATTSRSNRATRTLAAVAGREIEDQQFIGMAAPAEVVSTSVALEGQSQFQPGFPVSLQAIYYSLFGLADPEVFGPLGLTGPPTLILNLYNTPYVDPVGESLISLAYDAAATMLDVPIIFSAGEFGLIDNDTDCGTEIDELAPGAQRIGSRSLSSPATAFNGITVTAVGARTVNQTPQYQFPFYVLPSNTSAQGPIDTRTGDAINRNQRPGIDIAAPGWQSVLDTPVPPGPDGDFDPCFWFGHTPNGLINLPNNGEGANPDPNAFGLAGGTEVAAAIVAGAFALLQDVGNKFVDDQFPDGGLSTDQLVIKSIMLNSAVRTPGMTNTGGDGFGIPAVPVNRRDGRVWEAPGVVINGGAGGLDLAMGAGLLNVEQAALLYIGPGITKDPTETNPAVPAVTAPGPFIGEPIPSNFLGLLPGGVTPAGGTNPPIGTPGRNPGGTQPGVLGPLPQPGDLGPNPGPGDPVDPAGDFSLRFFLSLTGLAPNEDDELFNPFEPDLDDPSDFPAFEIDGPPENPRFATLAEFDPANPNDVQRIYIWAAMEGSQVEQTWDNIALGIEATGDARITNYEIFNLTREPIPGLEVRRWGVLNQGSAFPSLPNTQRINNIFANIGTDPLDLNTGIFKGPGVEEDIHYSTAAEATLIGFIDVVGQGEIFLEVGPNGINREDELPGDSRVFFGPGGTGAFADDNNPEIFGNDVGLQSAFPESLLETISLITTPIPVRRVGWDHGNLGVIGARNTIDYFIEEPYELDTLFTATLCWNRTVVIDANGFLNATEPGTVPTLLQTELEDLELQLWTSDPFGNLETLLVGSGGSQTNVEQLQFTSNFPGLQGASLVLRVVYSGQLDAFENADFADLSELDLGDYEFSFNRPGDVEFGLSWATWSTVAPDRPLNVQGLLGAAFNLPEELLLPQSVLENTSGDALVQTLGDILAAFGSSRGDFRYRNMIDLNNDGRIDTEDLGAVLGAF